MHALTNGSVRACMAALCDFPNVQVHEQRMAFLQELDKQLTMLEHGSDPLFKAGIKPNVTVGWWRRPTLPSGTACHGVLLVVKCTREEAVVASDQGSKVLG